MANLDIETGYQNANAIYFSSLLRSDTLQFDSSQIATLNYLAYQCPLLGGEAVFKARALLSAVLDTFYVDGNLCDTVSERSLAAKPFHNDTIQTLRVNLYPNPALDYAILQLNRDITPLQLKIFDATGKAIVNNSITTINGYYTINTSAFSSGLYYVSLFGSEGKLYGGELSIFMK